MCNWTKIRVIRATKLIPKLQLFSFPTWVHLCSSEKIHLICLTQELSILKSSYSISIQNKNKKGTFQSNRKLKMSQIGRSNFGEKNGLWVYQSVLHRREDRNKLKNVSSWTPSNEVPTFSLLPGSLSQRIMPFKAAEVRGKGRLKLSYSQSGNSD